MKIELWPQSVARKKDPKFQSKMWPVLRVLVEEKPLERTQTVNQSIATCCTAGVFMTSAKRTSMEVPRLVHVEKNSQVLLDEQNDVWNRVQIKLHWFQNELQRINPVQKNWFIIHPLCNQLQKTARKNKTAVMESNINLWTVWGHWIGDERMWGFLSNWRSCDEQERASVALVAVFHVNTQLGIVALGWMLFRIPETSRSPSVLDCKCYSMQNESTVEKRLERRSCKNVPHRLNWETGSGIAHSHRRW